MIAERPAGRLMSVNVGLPQDVAWHGQTVRTGVWKQPVDPEGLWERALANPGQYADYVVATQGDPVWEATRGKHLEALVEIHVTGQAPVMLYRAR